MSRRPRMIYDMDPMLAQYREQIDRRHTGIMETRDHIAPGGSLKDVANNHLYYGLHKDEKGDFVFREWAPNATRIYFVGDCNNWHRSAGYMLKPLGDGSW